MLALQALRADKKRAMNEVPPPFTSEVEAIQAADRLSALWNAYENISLGLRRGEKLHDAIVAHHQAVVKWHATYGARSIARSRPAKKT